MQNFVSNTDDDLGGGAFWLFFFILINAIKILIFDYFLSPTRPQYFPVLFNIAFTASTLSVFWAIVVTSRVKWLAVVAYTLQLIYVLASYQYFDYFCQYMRLGRLSSSLFEGGGVLLAGGVPFKWQSLLFLIDLPFFVTACWWRTVQIGFRVFASGAIVLVALLCVASLLNRLPMQIYKGNYGSEAGVIQYYGPLVLDFVQPDSMPGESSFAQGANLITPMRMATKPNFLVIQVEALGAQTIYERLGNVYVMPFLRNLAELNAYYPLCVSQHYGGGGTTDAEFTVLNGIQPLLNYPSLKVPGYGFANALPKALQYEGYHSYAYHNNSANYYNRGSAFARMGFDMFYDVSTMGLAKGSWGGADSDMFRFVGKAIRSGGSSPRMDFVITMSTHIPFGFSPPGKDDHLFDQVRDPVQRNYYRAFRQLDNSLRDFLRDVDAKNTYVFIYGDHTPGVKNSNIAESRVKFGTRDLELVPLIVVSPPGGKEVENMPLVTQADVNATIFALAGSQNSYRSDGANLFAKNSVRTPIRVPEGFYRRDGVLYKLASTTLKFSSHPLVQNN